MLGKGGKAKLIIPYYAAYGAQGRPGAIPPYSDLVFDIEIMDLQKMEKKITAKNLLKKFVSMNIMTMTDMITVDTVIHTRK